MGKCIRLSEEQLRNLIKDTLMEAINENTDLGYAPAIGNKKRGPGEDIEDQMKKRKNKKLDEGFGEDYDGEFGPTNSGVKTVEIGEPAYAFAFHEIYGRVPNDLNATLEDAGLPEAVQVKFNLTNTVSRGDYDTPGSVDYGIDNWDIDESAFENIDPEWFDVIRKAVEYEMENIDGNELSSYLNEKKVVKISESQLRNFIVESVKQILKK